LFNSRTDDKINADSIALSSIQRNFLMIGKTESVRVEPLDPE